MNTIILDFETFYSTKEKYDLRHMSAVEYVRHPKFHVQGCAIKIDSSPTQWITGEDIEEEFARIDWMNSRIVAHNVKFDGSILLWRYNYNCRQWIDTQSMAKAIIGNAAPSASLKHTAEYLGLPAKGELKTNNMKTLTPEQEAELARYCIRDTDLCHDIFTTLSKFVPGEQWQIMDWTVRAFLEPQLILDTEKCQAVYDSSIANKKKLIANAGVDPKELSSNPQFVGLLRREGFEVPMKKNKKGKLIPALSIQDKGFLDMLSSKDSRLKQLCQARVAVKQTLEETRALKLLNISKVSKYCFDVIFSGAQQTHRFSGGNGCAGNPQNFKRGSQLRAAIAVPKGKALVVADFSNIELRILAFLAQDSKLMQAIYNKEDVYCKFASEIYGFEVTKKNKKERALGKAAVLGLGYGMGAEKFRNTVFAQTGEMLGEEFAKRVVSLYRGTYIGVPKLWKLCEHVLEQMHSSSSKSFPGTPFLKVKKNAITLPTGLDIKYRGLMYTWKKVFGKFKKDWTYKRYKTKATQMDDTKIYGGMMTENLCQGLAGDVCKEAIRRLIDAGYPPSGQVHDELLVVCKEEEVEKVKKLVDQCMTDAMPWWPELPLAVEVGSGKNWLEAK